MTDLISTLFGWPAAGALQMVVLVVATLAWCYLRVRRAQHVIDKAPYPLRKVAAEGHRGTIEQREGSYASGAHPPARLHTQF